MPAWVELTFATIFWTRAGVYDRAVRVARNLVVAALAQLACTSHGQPEPEQATREQDKADPKPPAKPEPVAAPEPVATPPEPPAPAPAPPPPPPPRDAKPIEPEPGVVEWTELAGLSEITGFHPFVIGVLAKCGADGSEWCKLYDDGRLEVAPVDIGVEKIWDVWRSDAWRVDIDTREFETDDERAPIGMFDVVKVERWRGTAFHTQGRYETEVDPNGYYDDGERAEPAIVFRKGWAGGMLVYSGGWKRVPESGPPVPGVAIDFANRLKPREFLALVEGEQGNRVFATRGPAKPAPASAPSTTPQP